MTKQEYDTIFLQGVCHAIDVAEAACKQNALRSPAVSAIRKEAATMALELGLKGAQ